MYGLDRIAFPWFQAHARVINDFELVYNQALSFSEKCIVRRWKGRGLTCSINIHENFPFTLVIDTFFYIYLICYHYHIRQDITRTSRELTMWTNKFIPPLTLISKKLFFLKNICLIQLQPSLLFSDSQLKSMILNKF